MPGETPARVHLGQELFFDASLSTDGTVSCGSCHQPQFAYADPSAVSRGAHGVHGTRNAPSLIAVAAQAELFWDGRRTKLEAMVLDPLLHPREMALADRATLVRRVRQRHRFRHQEAFAGQPVSPQTIGRALAAFVRHLATRDAASPVERYLVHHELDQLTPAQVRGLHLFDGRAECSHCHSLDTPSLSLTDNAYHPSNTPAEMGPALNAAALEMADMPAAERFVLVGIRPEVAALGRYNVTLRAADIGRFRTPSLKNVALTAPYMHDGGVATLRDAVEHEIWARAIGEARLGRLTPQDREDLVAFLEGLTAVQQAPGRVVAEAGNPLAKGLP